MTRSQAGCWMRFGSVAILLLSVLVATCAGCRADNAYPDWSRRCRDGRPVVPRGVAAVWEDDVQFRDAILPFKCNGAIRVSRMSEIRKTAESFGMPAGCVPVLYYGRPNDSVWVDGYLIVSQSPYDPNSDPSASLLSRNPRKPKVWK